MQGIDLERARAIAAGAAGARITFAGGVTTPGEIAALDALGADAQVGMSLYRGTLDLAAGFVAPLRSDRADGLWPTIVQELDGSLLGLCYSSERSVRAAIDTGRGVYESRTRGLWVKGSTSGATQELFSIEVDCDRDALRFLVRQAGGGFCHRGTWNCFDRTLGLPALMQTLRARVAAAPSGSYTERLLRDPELLRAKLAEEALELAAAVDPDHVAAEAADVLYFACVALARGGVPLYEVWAHLDARAGRVSRRRGDAKPGAGGTRE
jgi:phosphoribosyl-ATP pyrophosphohydrolase